MDGEVALRAARAARALIVTLLSGGVGGARFAAGVVDAAGAAALTVIGNVGDDLEVLGLHVSPDLDTVLYTLAGVGDLGRGWGRADETWNALETVAELGGEAWFRLGDRDIGLHLVRMEALRRGEPLSAVTARLAGAFGLESRLLPATDDRLRTWVDTPAGPLPFQEWFVRRGHRDAVDGVRFEGAEAATPAPGVLEALRDADLLLIAPSNPFVSIGPILAVPAIREALLARNVPCVAVSPLIGGRAVKGPAAEMLARLAGGASPAQVTQCYLHGAPGEQRAFEQVTQCYKPLIDVLVFDEADADDAEAVAELGVRPLVTRTLMRDSAAARRLAEAALEAGAVLR
jgi:LPPG:FO 2-phospho-L-lactate transferase